MYYGVCLSVITANIGFSVFILNVNISGERNRQVPAWLRYFTLGMIKFLGNRVPIDVEEKWGINQVCWRYIFIKIDMKRLALI